jgi:hypothetical protein
MLPPITSVIPITICSTSAITLAPPLLPFPLLDIFSLIFMLCCQAGYQVADLLLTAFQALAIRRLAIGISFKAGLQLF